MMSHSISISVSTFSGFFSFCVLRGGPSGLVYDSNMFGCECPWLGSCSAVGKWRLCWSVFCSDVRDLACGGNCLWGTVLFC